MSKLDELIKELCPNGVEYIPIINLAEIGTGSHNTNEELDDGKYPFFVRSQTPRRLNTYDFDEEAIITAGDGVGVGKVFHYIEGKYALHQRAYRIHVTSDKLLPKYLLHYMKASFLSYMEMNAVNSSVTSVRKPMLEKYCIPVPPLEVQREIVHTLDSFTELTEELEANLSAELTARKKQYEFYRDKLLSRNKKYPMKSLADLGKWTGGKTPSMAEKSFWEDGTVPWISSKDMKVSTLSDTQDHITEKAVKEAAMTIYPANSIALVTRSGILKHTFPVAYVPFETTVNQDIKMLVVSEDILPRYAFHVIQGKGKDILAKTKKQGGTVDSLDFQKVLAYKVPVPSIDVQRKLVKVLDNFEIICSDLNIGLPSEIEARKKQYEYYRDVLLTFAECGETILTDRQTDRQTIIRLIQYVFGYALLSLEDIAHTFRGEYITKNSTQKGEIPVILGGQEPAYYIDKANHNGEIVVVARSGASAGYVSYWDEPIFVSDGFGYEAKEELVIPRFLFYVMKNCEPIFNSMKRGAGVPHVSGEQLAKVCFPIPSIVEQKRIVEILDRFDTLCNDIAEGLPTEIAARQKQYEYYREKLLNFKELNE